MSPIPGSADRAWDRLAGRAARSPDARSGYAGSRAASASAPSSSSTLSRASSMSQLLASVKESSLTTPTTIEGRPRRRLAAQQNELVRPARQTVRGAGDDAAGVSLDRGAHVGVQQRPLFGGGAMEADAPGQPIDRQTLAADQLAERAAHGAEKKFHLKGAVLTVTETNGETRHRVRSPPRCAECPSDRDGCGQEIANPEREACLVSAADGGRAAIASTDAASSRTLSLIFVRPGPRGGYCGNSGRWSDRVLAG